MDAVDIKDIFEFYDIHTTRYAVKVVARVFFWGTD
jgi:hypothetical protein